MAVLLGCLQAAQENSGWPLTPRVRNDAVLCSLCSRPPQLWERPVLSSGRPHVFNVGVGTPTPVTTVNVNWAFQANFQLPWNRSQIPLDILEANTAYITDARKKREVDAIQDDVDEHVDGDYKSDAKIYHFYKYIEDVLNGYGHNGSSCVLRTLCQLGADPLHTKMEDDLLHELASFVLNPENDATETQGSSPESVPYIQAHSAGKDNGDCFSLYDRCTIPLLDIFTKIRVLP